MRCQGFVAQHDNLLSTLTVWQTLMYAAMLRLPDEMPIRQKLCRAAHIMEDVGLSNVCHSLVGDVHGASGGNAAGSSGTGAKSISGGQRRRLSIAVELLANPSAIMLDEVSCCVKECLAC